MHWLGLEQKRAEGKVTSLLNSRTHHPIRSAQPRIMCLAFSLITGNGAIDERPRLIIPRRRDRWGGGSWKNDAMGIASTTQWLCDCCPIQKENVGPHRRWHSKIRSKPTPHQT